MIQMKFDLPPHLVCCYSKAGRPKRSFDSQEQAIAGKLNKRQRSYECIIHPGKWHLYTKK